MMTEKPPKGAVRAARRALRQQGGKNGSIFAHYTYIISALSGLVKSAVRGAGRAGGSGVRAL